MLIVPNIQDAPDFDGQAVPDQTDRAAEVAGAQGQGVLSGCTVTPHGSDMNVSVASGSVMIAGVVYTVTGANAAVTTASSSDRRDIVVYTVGTGLHVVAGTPCGTAGWTHLASSSPPVKPALPANSVLLAEVYVAASTTSIANGNLIDKTVLLTPVALTQAPLDDSTNVATTAYTDLAVGVETTRAEAGEATAQSNAETFATSAVATEATARAAGDATNASAISAETTRAEAAEALLDNFLVPQAVTTGTILNATGNKLWPLDTTSNAITATLPNAPADRTRIGFKLINFVVGNNVTIATAGSDVFNKTGGGTTYTMKIANQGVIMQYNAAAGIWYITSDDLPLGSLTPGVLQVVPSPAGMSFVPVGSLASGSSPLNTRRARIAFGDGAFGPTTGWQDVAFRAGFTVEATPVRCRVLIRNSDLLANTTTSQSMTITGVWIGTPNVGAEGAWLGDFTGAPTKVDNGTTQDLATEYATAWFAPPSSLVADALQGISVGVTSAVDNKINQGDGPGITWYGATGAGCAAAAGNAAAPIGTGTAAPYRCPLDIRLEFEFVGNNQIGLWLGTSLTAGYTSGGAYYGAMGPDNTWPQIAAKRLGHVAINGGIGGSQSINFTSTSALAWTRFDLTTTVPDYAVIDLGVNDCYIGSVNPPTTTTLCPDLPTFRANIQTIIANLQAAGIKRIYICTAPPGIQAPAFGNCCYQAGVLTSAIAAGSISTVDLNDSSSLQAGPGSGNPGSGADWYASAMATTVASCVLNATTTVTVASGGFPGVSPGMMVRGTDITDGTYVKSISGNTLILSQAATGSTTVTLTFTVAMCFFDLPSSGIAEGPFPLTAQSGTNPLALTAHGTTSNGHRIGAPVFTGPEGYRQQYNNWIRSGVPGTTATIDLDEVARQKGSPVIGGQAVPFSLQNWMFYPQTAAIHPTHPGMYHAFAEKFAAGMAGV